MRTNLTLLEYMLAALGLIVMVLSSWNFHAAWVERRALIKSRVNGELFALATRHLFTGFFRFLAGIFTATGGVWLITMPNDTDEPAVLAKHVWLFLMIVLVSTMVHERIMSHYVKASGRHHHEREDR
jgi:hypothetical protein